MVKQDVRWKNSKKLKSTRTEELLHRWNVSELSSNDSPVELVPDKLADHFSSITNLAWPLNMKNDIPKSTVGAGMIPQITVKNVAKVLKHYKKH